MITNKGSDIIAKYLLGQAPEYAAYLAVGVGATPLVNGEIDDSLPNKKSMDFEAFRIPVTSKGIVNDSFTKSLQSVTTYSPGLSLASSQNHGLSVGESVVIDVGSSGIQPFITEITSATTNTIYFASPTLLNLGTISSPTAKVTYIRDRLIFKGQLPPSQMYQMTEIALYPAINNQLAIGHDSRVLVSFSPTESWSVFGVSGEIPYNTQTLANNNNAIIATQFAQFINSDNIAFYGSEIRKARHEQPRFLNRCLIVSGELTNFYDVTFNPIGTVRYISNTNLTMDLSKYAPSDVVKFAIAVVSENEVSSPPYQTKIRFDFIDSDNRYISSTHTILGSTLLSRYVVLSEKLSDFYVSDSTFNWSKITGINVYVQTKDSGGAYEGSSVILDGIRIDDENITNPLYGMVAYSKLRNSLSQGLPIEKTENSQGYIEYRLGVSIT